MKNYIINLIILGVVVWVMRRLVGFETTILAIGTVILFLQEREKKEK